MTLQLDAMRAMARDMLHAEVFGRGLTHEWTVQGFGMLRCYLDPLTKRWRLNVWDSRLRIPDVSTCHDHPWGFTSWVLQGALYNTKYLEVPHGMPYQCAKIHTGIEASCAIEPPYVTHLDQQPTSGYMVGESYSQAADEIHSTGYTNGTVTLNDRQWSGPGIHARVFWPVGQRWGNAKPRVATAEEVQLIVGDALVGWPQ